jgi:PAS domain S-box-containing protein
MIGSRAGRLAAHGLVAGAGTLLWLMVAAALLAFAWYDHRQRLDDVQERNVLLARVLEDHATRMVDGAALAAATIDEMVTRGAPVGGPEMAAAMSQSLLSLPHLRGIAVVDLNGVIVASSDTAELGRSIDLARLGTQPPAARDILGPFASGRRLSDLAPRNAQVARGVGFLPLVRAASTPERRRLLVVALINVGALTNFQQTLLGDDRAAAALVDYAGRFIGGTAGIVRRVGEGLEALAPFTSFLPAREHGRWQGPGLRDGEQLAAFRVSRTRPLVVLVETDAAAANADWWHASRHLLGAGAAALAVIAAMTWLAVRSLRARDRAQAAVAKRERDFAITLQSLQELVFRCDENGRIGFVNAEWARATACSESACIGRPLGEFLPPSEQAAVAALLRADGGATVRRARLALAGADGALRCYEFSVMPLVARDRLEGFAGSAVDVTERVQAQRRLEQQLAFSELLLESSPLPMSVIGADRRYRIVNKAWEVFVGRQRESVVGAEAGRHLSPAERAVHEQHDTEVQATRAAVRYDARVRHTDGSLRDVVVEKRALPADPGHPADVLTVLIDVTEFREAERATREARDAAEEASRAKTEFIANISHELRTPLQSIIGFSELGLRRAGEQVRLGAMFGDIHASGQRMLSLVNDLLDVSRLDSTVGTMHLERTDLRALVREVLREMKPLAAQRRVTLDAVLAEQPMRAKVDPLRFQQVLRNVVANAVKFSPSGETIEVRGGLGANGQWRIEVADRGPGIPEAELERVFEAFVQSSLTKDGSGGTGLGLAICRKIMHALDGRIAARHRDGGGTVFEVELPAGGGETEPAAL